MISRILDKLGLSRRAEAVANMAKQRLTTSASAHDTVRDVSQVLYVLDCDPGDCSISRFRPRSDRRPAGRSLSTRTRALERSGRSLVPDVCKALDSPDFPITLFA